MIQQLDFFKAPAPMIEQPSFIGADNTLILFPPSLEPTGAEAAERRAARLREIEDRKAAKTFEAILNGAPGRATKWQVTAPAPSPAERGETVSVPTYGIANADPLNMTKRNFEAWMAVQSEGPTKDAIRAARDKKEAWARRELEKLAQPVRRDYFGANGPTGHGEECHSDADPGL